MHSRTTSSASLASLTSLETRPSPSPGPHFPAPFIVHPTRPPHTHTLIFLHGRGDTGQNFGSLFYTAPSSSDFVLSALYPGLKFVFPTCARRWSNTLRCFMTEWFDGGHRTKTEHLKNAGWNEVLDYITSSIQNELDAGIPSEHIFLGGISMGCAAALVTLLGRINVKLGGFVGIAGYMPFYEVVKSAIEKEAEIERLERDAKHCGGEIGEVQMNDSWIEKDREKLEAKESLSSGIGIDAFDTAPDSRYGGALSPTLISLSNGSSGPRKATTLRQKMAGVNTLRRLLKLEEAREGEVEELLKTPVFVCHGTADFTVHFDHGERMAKTLRLLGMDVRWDVYPDHGHWWKHCETVDGMIAFFGEKSGLLPE